MQNQFDINLSDLDLPYTASPIMNYHDPAVAVDGDFIAVGYLADDHDCENPLTCCDGEGRIYSSHRFSDNHAEMQEALALDGYWSPDLDLLDDHLDALRPIWIDDAKSSVEFIDWAKETAGPTAQLDDAYFHRRAVKFWRETGGTESPDGNSSIDDFSFSEDAKLKAWRELRSAGEIGDQDAVVLDVYEHGGQHWSLSGGGMQCRFDTAKGAGVWVPDNAAREEIERRAEVYQYGAVIKNGPWTRGSGKLRYSAVPDEAFGAERSPEFKKWHEAFAWLEAKAKSLRLPRSKGERAALARRGRERAAREIASGALDVYNDWLAGSCFGVIVASYANVGTADEPEWEMVEEEHACWGYIGDDDSMEMAQMEVDAIVANWQKQAA